MLTSKQRAILRGKANTMDPVYIVGKGEIEASQLLAEATGADCVQVIGSKFVLYLQKKKDSAYADLLK